MVMALFLSFLTWFYLFTQGNGPAEIEVQFLPKLDSKDFASVTWEDAEDLRDHHLAEFPESRRIFQRDGNFYKPGETFRQPDLARTLERIADNPQGFYSGSMARELAASVKKGGGLITVEDLARYEVKEREPIRGTYREYEIISAPPPSSGGVALIEILNILEGYDLAKLGNQSAASVRMLSGSSSSRARIIGAAMTRIAAATGIAISAPMRPSTLPPSRAASSTATAMRAASATPKCARRA